MLHSLKSILLRTVLVAVCAAGFFSVPSFAQKPENPPEPSDKLAENIQKLGPLIEAKKWDEVVALLDASIAKSEPNSFDLAFCYQIKAQVLGSKGDYGAAIFPLEQSVKIADSQRFFRFARVLPMSEQESLINLSSLYLQSVEVAGATLEMRRAAYLKALGYANRLVEGRKPTLDAQYTVARILYGLASVEGSKVDMVTMKKARDAAEETLLLAVKPKEEHYTLLLATLQQLGDNARCAQLIELMLSQNPNNKSYWEMLLGTYISLQGTNTKDNSADLRAITTLERAQAAGQLKTPRYNFSLAGLYYNIAQYAKAAEILDKGLKGGTIENDLKNWELLAACYQQQNREDKSIETFLEAIQRFPKVASLEYSLGNIYYNLDRQSDAYTHLLAAVNKGLERPAQTLVLISYLALEMKRLDDALSAAERAFEADPRSKEAQSILKVIKDSIEEREKFLNQAK